MCPLTSSRMRPLRKARSPSAVAGTAISDGESIIGLPSSFQQIAGTQILGIQLPVYILLVLAAVLWFVLEHTPLGRYVYATGGNPDDPDHRLGRRGSGSNLSRGGAGCVRPRRPAFAAGPPGRVPADDAG